MTMVRGLFRADDVDVQDKWGNQVRAVAVACAAVLSLSTLTAFVGFDDPASADTVVTSAYAAAVVLPDGSQHEAREGDRLPAGAQLRTGQGGGARLTTAGRDVYVGALTTVTVLDGVRETLERGQVMVDSRRGPQLDLAVPSGTSTSTVTTRQGALSRVERGTVLRVGVFEGSGRVAVSGRQATTGVPALHQVIAQYGTLPGTPTALVLTRTGSGGARSYDDWERRLAAALVSADEVLTRLQSGLRGTEGEVVLASTRRELVDVAASCPAAVGDRGERALSVAVGQAAQAPGSALEHLGAVCSARGEGGSWGVVAAMVQAPVTRVSGQLNAALDPGSPDGPGVVAGPSGLPVVTVPTTTPTPGRPRPTGSPTMKPHGDPSPSTSTPPPALVDQVVDIVTGLVPTPSPAAPAPSSTPLLQVGGIRIG